MQRLLSAGARAESPGQSFIPEAEGRGQKSDDSRKVEIEEAPQESTVGRSELRLLTPPPEKLNNHQILKTGEDSDVIRTCEMEDVMKTRRDFIDFDVNIVQSS